MELILTTGLVIGGAKLVGRLLEDDQILGAFLVTVAGIAFIAGMLA